MNKPLPQRMYRSFVSRKTTVLLIVVLTGFYFLGLVIPQESIMPPDQFAAWQAKNPALVRTLSALKMTSIYSSPYVLTVTAVFFLNLALVTAQRIPGVIRETRLNPAEAVTPEALKTAQATVRQPLREGEGPERFIDAARARGFAVVAADGRFLGVKNRYAAWGSILFHASFIVMLAGGLLIFHTRFRGEAVLTEGQVFGGTRDEYRSRMRLSELRKELPDIRFLVEKIEPRFEKQEAVSLRTVIRAESGQRIEQGTLNVNHPFRSGPTSVLITDVGIAPLFLLLDQNGREEFGAYVNLNIMRGTRDHFLIPGKDIRVDVSFWPDVVEDAQGARATASYELKNPLFAITVTHRGDVVQSSEIRGKQDFVAIDGNKLFIPDIRYYGTFVIVDEHGGAALMTGFVMAVIGAMIKLLWGRRTVMGIVAESGAGRELMIGYRQEYYRSGSGQELDRVLAMAEVKRDRS